MPDHATMQPGFSEPESDNLTRYRPMSRAAVASLVLGVLSISAVASPVMWWLPAAGVVLAVIALNIIAANRGEVLGRKTAIMGLAMGLLFGTWGVTKFLTLQSYLYQHARQHVESWIGLVQDGRLLEAHELHLYQEDRQNPGVSLQRYYDENEGAAGDYDYFFDQSPLKEIVALKGKGRLRFVRNEGISAERISGGTLESVRQRFAIDWEVDGASESIPFIVVVGRRRLREFEEARWHLREVLPVDST
jgi:hypothetical protein